MAIKYLRAELLADPLFAGMFRGEAEVLGAMDDANVVRLYEYVEAPGGAAIVMELVDGVSLRDILVAQGATTPEAALVVLQGSLLGLAIAHRRGVVHRDYKPENILVAGDGASKLTDFGLAARSGDRPVPAGTLLYVAPEQIAGGLATPASDVYSATATFYECLTGVPPFGGSAAELMRQHRSAPVPLDPVPGPLRPLIEAGMAKYAADRPAGRAHPGRGAGRRGGRGLRPGLGGARPVASSARPRSRWPRCGPRRPRRRPRASRSTRSTSAGRGSARSTPALVIAVAAVAAAGGTALASTRTHAAPPPAAHAPAPVHSVTLAPPPTTSAVAHADPDSDAHPDADARADRWRRRRSPRPRRPRRRSPPPKKSRRRIAETQFVAVANPHVAPPTTTFSPPPPPPPTSDPAARLNAGSPALTPHTGPRRPPRPARCPRRPAVSASCRLLPLATRALNVKIIAPI